MDRKKLCPITHIRLRPDKWWEKTDSALSGVYVGLDDLKVETASLVDAELDLRNFRATMCVNPDLLIELEQEHDESVRTSSPPTRRCPLAEASGASTEWPGSHADGTSSISSRAVFAVDLEVVK